jgi:hypothetical protein
MFNFKEAIGRKVNNARQNIMAGKELFNANKNLFNAKKDRFSDNFKNAFTSTYTIPGREQAFREQISRSKMLRPAPIPTAIPTPTASPTPAIPRVMGARQAQPAMTPMPSRMPTRMPTQSPAMPIPKPTSIVEQQPFPEYLSSVSTPEYLDLVNYISTKSAEIDLPMEYPMGQAAEEAMHGNSRRAKEDNNWFGIGVYNDNSRGINSGSPQESFDTYAKLISTDPRYAKAYAVRHDPNKFFDELAKVPYAANPNYKRNVMNTRGYRYGKELRNKKK